MAAGDRFYVRGGDVGCLLIHGFSGSPADLRPLADALAQKGYTVDLPLLPGHGSMPMSIGESRWHRWTEAVRAAHEALRRSCQAVVIVGYSMGGSLAIYESARQPPSGLVLLAVPTFVTADWRANFLPLLKYVVRWWYPMARADFGDPATRAGVLLHSPDLDLHDSKVQEELRRAVRIPTAAIDHFFRITRRARRLIGRITAPALIVQGRLDRTALPVCAEELYRGLGSLDKQFAWFERADHMLVAGAEGRAVIERIVSWIDAQVGHFPQAPSD